MSNSDVIQGVIGVTLTFYAAAGIGTGFYNSVNAQQVLNTCASESANQSVCDSLPVSRYVRAAEITTAETMHFAGAGMAGLGLLGSGIAGVAYRRRKPG
jgi:hypothetical protein